MCPKVTYARKEVVPEVGLEPTHPEGRGILNPLRLPIPPPGQELSSQRILLSVLKRLVKKLIRWALMTAAIGAVREALFRRNNAKYGSTK